MAARGDGGWRRRGFVAFGRNNNCGGKTWKEVGQKAVFPKYLHGVFRFLCKPSWQLTPSRSIPILICRLHGWLVRRGRRILRRRAVSKPTFGDTFKSLAGRIASQFAKPVCAVLYVFFATRASNYAVTKRKWPTFGEPRQLPDISACSILFSFIEEPHTHNPAALHQTRKTTTRPPKLAMVTATSLGADLSFGPSSSAQEMQMFCLTLKLESPLKFSTEATY